MEWFMTLCVILVRRDYANVLCHSNFSIHTAEASTWPHFYFTGKTENQKKHHIREFTRFILFSPLY